MLQTFNLISLKSFSNELANHILSLSIFKLTLGVLHMYIHRLFSNYVKTTLENIQLYSHVFHDYSYKFL